MTSEIRSTPASDRFLNQYFIIMMIIIKASLVVVFKQLNLSSTATLGTEESAWWPFFVESFKQESIYGVSAK